MIYLLGSIPLGVVPLTGPMAHDFSYANTFAQHMPTRGKPVLQEIGEELDTRNFSFFFSEEFCSPATELAKLEAAFALKTPMPLVLGNGVFNGKRYVVEMLSGQIVKTGRNGAPVRIEARIGLLEDPVAGGLFGLLNAIAKSRAPALSGSAATNPEVKK
ncbi:phage tail protein [Allorhizobium sp. BGMRC 0089]|uniref:phage tail protein n=1 Tax=Allorhizobium sonneratiae TaxID=2934936 RepID=UPI0020343C84|nr:phage tail protein [Allorhizobium sonneratiae]MCM2291096.1 phage tail protein [Allorhizobium sonneratiae]